MFVIRDPIHGDIQLDENEKKFIDNCLFIQRLHYIKQNGLLFLIYPGAQHTRFSHSLGCMHLATKYITNLSETSPEVIKYKSLIRLAALCHDIGHGPFSHSWEQALVPEFSKQYTIESVNNIYNTTINVNINKWHDYMRHCIIESQSVKTLLENIFAINPYDIIATWYHPLFKTIIQGDWGADRLDYLLRDSYFCGTKHFSPFNADRIINNSYIEGGKLHYKNKISDDLENAISIRNFMYKHLYLHNKNVKTENQLKVKLQKHFDLQSIQKLQNNPQDYLTLTDDYILNHLNVIMELLTLRKNNV